METGTEYTLDFRGAIASITLLELTNLFREMKEGQTLEIFVSDPDTITDIFKVLPAAAHELIDMEEEDSAYRIIIKKTMKTS